MPAHWENRDEVIQRLRRDLIGPEVYGGEVEAIESIVLDDISSPQFRYTIGHLHPQSWSEDFGDHETSSTIFGDSIDDEIQPFDGEEEQDAEDDGTFQTESIIDDEEVKSNNRPNNISSFGITVCFTEHASEAIRLVVSYARYRFESIPDHNKNRWIRQPFQHQIRLDFNEISTFRKSIRTLEDDPMAHLELIPRKSATDGKTRLTIRLVNTVEINDDGGQFTPQYRFNKGMEWVTWPQPPRVGWRPFRDTLVIHQPKLEIQSTELDDVRRQSMHEDALGSLLYHESIIWATGHNIGVGWNESGTSVYSDWIPWYEVPKLVNNPQLDKDLPKSMDDYCDMNNRDNIQDAFQTFLASYRTWLNHLESNGAPSGVHQSLTERFTLNIQAAKEACDRIEQGINHLRERSVWRSFVFMNQAIRDSQRCPAAVRDRPFLWRPFQIVFILLNLRGLTRRGSNPDAPEERKILDLLWYPTGGGKTEAYLGLIAFSAFHRRLQNDEDGEATVAIMRYTLRLLTMQQGERATRLILAMNRVRNRNPIPLEGVPFSIGMWIGNKTSPGTVQNARKTLQMKFNGKSTGGRAEPMQLAACPWCGTSYETENDSCYNLERADQGRAFAILCSSPSCDYHDDPLPYSCIDEELYRHPPTLLISTVDKFARMASKPDAGVFLGQPTEEFPYKNVPPELIVLDEMHLLSGPLGSIAGLWEAGLQTVMGDWKPKYIAATATIRGADREVRSMFGRELRIFPPPAASIRNNFFAIEKTKDETDSSRGRIHMSLIAPTRFARAGYYTPMASILQSAGAFSQIYDQSKVDPWWSIVSYFNSRKEMAAAHNMLGSQVRTTSDLIAEERSEQSRVAERIDELHGGRKPSELKEAMRRLEIPFGSENDDLLDVLQTTNMFQVGIDIDRLGVMVLTGQPYSNAEYVQASGRVGRQVPGLVLTTLRGSKPRDLSFYENHQTFHRRLYANVEAGTTTPFSPAVLDRVIRSLIMLLARNRIDKLRDEEDIVNLRTDQTLSSNLKALLRKFVDIVRQRTDDHRIVRQVEQSVNRMYQDLRAFVEVGDGIRWRAHRGTPGWGHQVMTLRGGNGPIIDSMRDVDVPVPISREPKEGQDPWKIVTLPARQLFFRSGPGMLWEDENGQTHMTLGLHRWQIDPVLRQTPVQEKGLAYSNLILEHMGHRMKDRYDGRVMKFHRPPRDGNSEGMVTVDRMPYHRVCVNGHLGVTTKDEKCSRDGCEENTSPVPLVSVCEHGHIEPFAWNVWAEHEDDCKYRQGRSVNHLSIIQPKGSTSITSWSVKCDGCGKSTKLQGVTSRGWKCTEREPWNERYEPDMFKERLDVEEGHQTSHLDRGNSGVGTGEQYLALEIPPVNWHMDRDDKPILRGVLRRKDENRMLGRLQREIEDADGEFIAELSGEVYLNEDSSINKDRLIGDALAHFRSTKDRSPDNFLENLRADELKGFVGKGTESNNPWVLDNGKFRREIILNQERSFSSASLGGPDSPIAELVRIDQMEAIRMLTGVTRLGGDTPAPIWKSESGTPYGLAEYEMGEGIYVGLNLEWAKKRVTEYRKLNRSEKMFNRWMESIWPETKEQIELKSAEDAEYMVLVHTFSHLLMKQICTIAGYPMSSLTERLYINRRPSGKIDRLGVLVYVTGAGSAGTLGGLSSLATEELMEEILTRILEAAEDCSNDPICGSHEPDGNDRSGSNGAACHSCLLLPEVSCELGNLLLDRAVFNSGVVDDGM